MSPTTQALLEWESSLKLLQDIKAHAATQPSERAMPQHLASDARRGRRSASATARLLTSPADVWRQLLQQQVNHDSALQLVLGFFWPDRSSLEEDPSGNYVTLTHAYEAIPAAIY
jgi:hypothetical protein